MKTTKKDLIEAARQLGAEKIAGNVYAFENAIYGKKGHRIIAYAIGAHDCSARLDSYEEDGKIKYVYFC